MPFCRSPLALSPTIRESQHHVSLDVLTRSTSRALIALDHFISLACAPESSPSSNYQSLISTSIRAILSQVNHHSLYRYIRAHPSASRDGAGTYRIPPIIG